MVATNSRNPRDGRYLEILGTYDPCNITVSKDSDQKQEKGICDIKTDRVSYWLENGAQLSPTVKNLLKRNKFFDQKAA